MPEEFTLGGKEFIELNKLLKYLGWVDTGGAAKEMISSGQVKVNDEQELRIRRKLRLGDRINFEKQTAVIKD